MMNSQIQKLGRFALRIITVLLLLGGVSFLAFWLWRPGLDMVDGRHDKGSNGVWLAHGWLGADEWFEKNHKTNELARYREPRAIEGLAAKLRLHRITDVYPHLCPAEPLTGAIPPVDAKQVERFLNAFANFRVFPWIGGPNGSSVQLHNPKWRSNFVASAQALLNQHPRLAGVHLNVEPLTSGDKNFLLLLGELRSALPKGRLLSLAAYPPPTRWHPSPEVHWDEPYFREVARHCDQLAVMMYDAAQTIPKTYQHLMAQWTVEVLTWSEGRPVLLGVPTYEDAGVEYHVPHVENITNALLGIHQGLSKQRLSPNYQGVAIYCDWETSDAEWAYFRQHFLRAQPPRLPNTDSGL